MFNKKKCEECYYQQWAGSGSRNQHNTATMVGCGYHLTGTTCLQRQSNNNIIDLRGDDPNNCKLFVKKEGKTYAEKTRAGSDF